MTHHYLNATPDNVHWGYWDATIPPVLKIKSGDHVTIETVSGDVPHLPKQDSGFDILPDHRAILDAGRRGLGPHHLTGPIEIEGAEPGHVLEVRILDIKLRQNWGWNIQRPCMGTLPEDFQEPRLFHIALDAVANTGKLPWGQVIPLDPFFGAFGVAPPPNWGRLSSKEPRAFGGNMDNKELGAGAKVYFPVFTRGALFSAGDGHALQGDGEVCLSAIETALTGTFEFILRKDMRLQNPRAERDDVWITMGFDEDLDDAVKHALRDMIRLIGELTGLGASEAYTLCSLAADLRVTQTVDGNKGIHCVVRKDRLPRLTPAQKAANAPA
ncbi:MAG: acetamidase/formamidase family protein [Methylobacteriaceae bacterium]|nr:acetamidase/formamidase family protein [Methylobacteriaceae bacterium]